MALKDLFKRKPGGTFVGNLLRGAANKASGGVLGNGAMMITQEQADIRDLSNDAYIAKYGKTKEGVIVAPQSVNNQIASVDQRFDAAGKPVLKEAAKPIWKKALSALVSGLAIAGGVWGLLRKESRRKTRY